MMIKVGVPVPQLYEKDLLFDPPEYLNRDNCLATWKQLKKQAEMNGIELHTLDVFLRENEKPELVIFSDIPQKGIKSILDDWAEHVVKWVILSENEIISPWNWVTANHEEFSKIFTWNDDFVDNKKYFKLNNCVPFPEKIYYNPERQNKITLIAGNKIKKHPLELYSHRKKAIEWFERFHPSDFEFYGTEWNFKCFSNRPPFKYLNRIGLLKKILATKYKTYKGAVKEKIQALSKYRFAICYENARDIPGYITEKIFDCFFGGCIPIYWGAPNIAACIPQECYIDKREHPTLEELYMFCMNMRPDTYNLYIDEIARFVNSNLANKFKIGCFAETLISHINQYMMSNAK